MNNTPFGVVFISLPIRKSIQMTNDARNQFNDIIVDVAIACWKQNGQEQQQQHHQLNWTIIQHRQK